MSAEIIPFPMGRVHRDPDVLEALEKLELCREMIATGEPHKVAVAGIMRDWWEKELERLTGAGGTVH
jgi:hypothetical protein